MKNITSMVVRMTIMLVRMISTKKEIGHGRNKKEVLQPDHQCSGVLASATANDTQSGDHV